jgi:signal transduction histidine kinase
VEQNTVFGATTVLRSLKKANGSDDIEPGILPMFRLLTLVAWLILCPSLLSLLAPHQLPNYLAIFCWIQYSLLWAYLSWQWLCRMLGRWYLPIALGMSAIAPVVFQMLAAKMRLDRGVLAAEALKPSPNSLYVWLLIPLLLGAMQYGYRVLLIIMIGTSGLSVFLAHLLIPAIGNTVTEQAITRLLMLTIAGAIVVRLSKVQRQQRQELMQKNMQLTHYATTLEQLAISRERDRQLCLQITDDGVGFDLNRRPSSGHYGLLGMQERANLIGGQLTIHSQLQQGTTIQLDVSIKSRSARAEL